VPPAFRQRRYEKLPVAGRPRARSRLAAADGAAGASSTIYHLPDDVYRRYLEDLFNSANAT
jgi:hypothetical protein